MVCFYYVQTMQGKGRGYHRMFPLPFLYAMKPDPYSRGLFGGSGGRWGLKMNNI